VVVILEFSGIRSTRCLLVIADFAPPWASVVLWLFFFCLGFGVVFFGFFFSCVFLFFFVFFFPCFFFFFLLEFSDGRL